jgi:hypothetical protein
VILADLFHLQPFWWHLRGSAELKKGENRWLKV